MCRAAQRGDFSTPTELPSLSKNEDFALTRNAHTTVSGPVSRPLSPISLHPLHFSIFRFGLDLSNPPRTDIRSTTLWQEQPHDRERDPHYHHSVTPHSARRRAARTRARTAAHASRTSHDTDTFTPLTGTTMHVYAYPPPFPSSHSRSEVTKQGGGGRGTAHRAL